MVYGLDSKHLSIRLLLLHFQLNLSPRSFHERLEQSLDVVRAVQEESIVVFIPVIAFEHARDRTANASIHFAGDFGLEILTADVRRDSDRKDGLQIARTE